MAKEMKTKKEIKKPKQTKHSDEAQDKALIKKMMAKKACK